MSPRNHPTLLNFKVGRQESHSKGATLPATFLFGSYFLLPQSTHPGGSRNLNSTSFLGLDP